MLDVFFYEAFEEEAAAIKSHLPAGISAGFTWKTIQEAGDIDPPARVVSIRTQSRIPSAWNARLPVLLSRSTGYDHIHRFLARVDTKPTCGHLPCYCSRAVAEHALLILLALLRRLPRQVEQFRDFSRDGLTGWECQAKTLVVVGVGRIGSELVRLGRVLDMEVFGVDLVERHDFVNYLPIEAALQKADIVVCAMNLTADNIGYFNYARLKQARKGVIFVNIARGEMSPSQDLLRLMEEDHLGGLGLDVYNEEAELAVALRGQNEKDLQGETEATLELSKKNNVLFTPHNAFNTVESVQRKAEQTVQQLVHFLEHGSFLWPVP